MSTTTTSKTLILDNIQIQQKINRIAHQVLEHNYDKPGIVIAGINERGFVFAQKLATILSEISKLKIELVNVQVNTESFVVSVKEGKETNYSNVLIADDVLNSGKTLLYAVHYFLKYPVEKLSTAVLVNRGHHNFPVKADYVGLSLATTMQEHVYVRFNEDNKDVAYLS
jgi:pyrimidine operon attenuation protein/uracil phosphoribosyltransferase